MNNKFEDIAIKNGTFYFFNDITHIKIFDPNNIKIDGESYKNILIYYIGYVKIKDSKHVKIYCVNPLYIYFDKVNGHFEEINRKKYFTQVPSNENKGKTEKNEELWIKIRDLIKLINKNSDD